MRNLADNPAHADDLARLEKELRRLLDPGDVNKRAIADQQTAIKLHGGVEAILSGGSYGYNPVPGQKAAITKFDKT